ncbi:PD-(D/E)XK nuclease family protein [Bacteroidota bacterium]
MILKRADTHKTTYTILDLLGTDETALSKAFAFLLANDSDCYFHFLRYLGVPIKNTVVNYKNASITIEKKRNEGRTDIELYQVNKYHIIVECKIGKGKVTKQRTQYLTAFDISSTKKILCILTQERDTNKQIDNDVIIKNTSWLEIIELFNNKYFIHKPIVTDFLKFATKNYKMREIKEILIQGLGNHTEIKRFKEFGIYRRGQTFGTPIYFAPYFNRDSGETEGITKLSKIIGILTFKPDDIENFRSDLESFSDNPAIVNKWINGINLGNDHKDSIYTYYFLDEPFTFRNPLKKDGGIKKGRGKNWIAANIPRNRCVSFIEFIKHIPDLME